MHQMRCCDCGNKMEALRTNRLYCPPCRRVRKNDSSKLHAIEHPERRAAAAHSYYVRKRKNNREWHFKNAAQAKVWRALNPEKNKQYHPPKRPQPSAPQVLAAL